MINGIRLFSSAVIHTHIYIYIYSTSVQLRCNVYISRTAGGPCSANYTAFADNASGYPHCRLPTIHITQVQAHLVQRVTSGKIPIWSIDRQRQTTSSGNCLGTFKYRLFRPRHKIASLLNRTNGAVPDNPFSFQFGGGNKQYNQHALFAETTSFVFSPALSASGLCSSSLHNGRTSSVIL